MLLTILALLPTTYGLVGAFHQLGGCRGLGSKVLNSLCNQRNPEGVLGSHFCVSLRLQTGE